MLASWFAPEWLVRPMTQLLAWFLGITGSYGMAIILLTLVVRFIILPLTIHQMKSMKRMQEIQPRMKELQAKYKDEPAKLNQEMMALYKNEGVNPFSGCLPLLVQMPFLYAMFAALQAFNPAAYGSFGVSFLWITNLNQPHDLILTVLTVVSMLAQSWLTGAASDPNQRMMMYMMPVMFGWMGYNMQAGVVLYWVVSTIFGLVQQAIYPGFPRLRGDAGAKGEAGAR